MQRKRYSDEFKGQIALEAAKGLRTIAEIASEHGLHPNQISQWKKELLEGLPAIFHDKRKREHADEEKLKERLYGQIGQLKVELDWLKKKTGFID